MSIANRNRVSPCIRVLPHHCWMIHGRSRQSGRNLQLPHSPAISDKRILIATLCRSPVRQQAIRTLPRLDKVEPSLISMSGDHR